MPSPPDDPRRVPPSRRPHLRGDADRAARRWALGDAQTLRRLAPASGTGALRWDRRTVESFGLTHRISVPWQAGDLSAPVIASIGELLSGWWTSRSGALAPGVLVTSVSAAMLPGPRTHRVVVIVTTDRVVEPTDVASPTMDRDLRRAARLAGQAHESAATDVTLRVVPGV